MNKEEIFELSRSTVNELVTLIRNDIYELGRHGIYENRIRISIPQCYIPFLKNCLTKFYHPGIYHFFEPVFGKAEIVPGYNNQICVFDIDASPNFPGLKPINVKFYG